MPAARAIIHGRVQGIGYRYATQTEAIRLGLTGWVRNLPDGRVEAFFEGPRDGIESMLEWCGSGPRLARVDGVETQWLESAAEHSTFAIR